MDHISKNAECVLKIIKSYDGLTTAEILELAKREEFADICTNCAGGDAFVAAANELVERGLIKKQFGKGGYRWYLMRRKE